MSQQITKAVIQNISDLIKHFKDSEHIKIKREFDLKESVLKFQLISIK